MKSLNSYSSVLIATIGLASIASANDSSESVEQQIAQLQEKQRKSCEKNWFDTFKSTLEGETRGDRLNCSGVSIKHEIYELIDINYHTISLSDRAFRSLPQADEGGKNLNALASPTSRTSTVDYTNTKQPKDSAVLDVLDGYILK